MIRRRREEGQKIIGERKKQINGEGGTKKRKRKLKGLKDYLKNCARKA